MLSIRHFNENRPHFLIAQHVHSPSHTAAHVHVLASLIRMTDCASSTRATLAGGGFAWSFGRHAVRRFEHTAGGTVGN